MRCASCGHQTPIEDERFCEACGKPLHAAPADLPNLAPSLGPAVVTPRTPETASSDRFASAGNSQKVKGGPARWRQMGWAALAVLLYLIIADTVIETLLSQSPLRWWVAGILGVYLLLNLVVWYRWRSTWLRSGWAHKAAMSFGLLLAVMGLTAWLPGGLEQGLSLLGQPTSTVLAIVSAAAVAFSGVILVRLPRMPLAGRIVGGLLAAYGVAAFLLAISAGTPYADLFHGASQWSRLPSWLQGATVGGLLVVPLALLVELVTGLPRVTHATLSEFGLKATALGMSLVMSLAAVRIPTDTGTGMSADYDSGVIEPPPWLSASGEERFQQGEAGYKQVSEKLDRMYAASDVVNSKMDRSLFEIDALASRLNSDPVAMFHFVRDEVRYEPYTGVLRGALGTLLCRAGNSLDRSLLLAAMLEKAGFNTQIATGQLTAQQSKILVSRLFEPVRSVPSAVPSFAELAPDLALAMGVDQAKLMRVAGEVQEYGEKQKTKLLNYVDSATNDLLDLLNKAGVDAGVITPSDELLAEAGEHYWVQYQDPSGQWVDLDSAFTNAEPGKVNAQATNTFAPDSMPEELYHHLRITLTLRVAQVVNGNDGSVTDTALIDQEVRVADQQGVDIILANQPSPMPNFMNPKTTLASALAPIKGYQAVLQVGSQVTSGKYFDLSGKISDARGGSAEGEVVANAGGIGKSMGGLAGGISGALDGEASQATTTRIVGEWADYKLTSPLPRHEAPLSHNYHRDIIAPTQVTSWSARSPESPQQIPTNLDKTHLRQRLLWFTELLPVTGAIITDYAGYLASKLFSDNRASIDTLAKMAFGVSQTGNPAILSDRPRITSLSLVTGATQIVNNLGRTRFASLRSYFGRPGLVAYENASGDTSDRLKRGYDIIAFPSRIVGDPASASDGIRRDASSLHLLGGVLATRLELELMASAPDRSTTGPPPFNATRVFAAAKKNGVPVVVLRPGVDGLKKLSDTSLPESVKAELSTTLATGDDVVAPVRQVVLDGRQQFAWWRFEPASGQVRGVMPGGRGQALEETLELAWQGLSFVTCLYDCYTSEEPPEKRFGKLAGCEFGAAFFAQGGPWWMYKEQWVFFDIVSVFLWHAAS